MLCPGLMSYGCARKDNYEELVVTRTYVYDLSLQMTLYLLRRRYKKPHGQLFFIITKHGMMLLFDHV